MAWKEINSYQQKLKFVADYLAQKYCFKTLCDYYGVSRKTGYKLINRFLTEGHDAFNERSRCRLHHPNKTPDEVIQQLLQLKSRFPLWGPAKIKAWFLINQPDFPSPAVSVIADIFKKYGLVKPRKVRKKVSPFSQPFLDCNESNAVWSADFKGKFRLGDGEYCYPLTISDNYSRFILGCQALHSPNHQLSMEAFKKVFKEYGLPHAIRTDNGQPFAGLGIGALSQLSIWWLKLGIFPERIALGRPEQNGRHERMHRTLKQTVTNDLQIDFKNQQKQFERFQQEFNFERPHEALNNQRPNDVYQRSFKVYPNKIPEVIYPENYLIRKVRSSGEIKWCGQLYYVSELLYHEPIGFERIEEGVANLYFGQLKLGIIDGRLKKIIRL